MAGDRLRIVMSSIMRRRRGLNSAISLLLFQRLRFNSRNPSKQKPQPQTDPPNAASAASFNLEASVRSACSTEPAGGSSDLIASRIERSRGSVWRYGDCSPEERSGSSWPGLVKGLRDAVTAKEHAGWIERRLMAGDRRQDRRAPSSPAWLLPSLCDGQELPARRPWRRMLEQDDEGVWARS